MSSLVIAPFSRFVLAHLPTSPLLVSCDIPASRIVDMPASHTRPGEKERHTSSVKRNNVVSDLDVVYTRPDGLDDTAAFVAEDHREGAFGVVAGESVGVSASVS